MSEQAGRYQRSFAGLIGSMIVLLLVVAAFVIFRDTTRNDPVDPVRAVDYRRPAQFARQEATFKVLTPRSLPEGWIASSVGFVGGEEQSWHLGVLTDTRRYVGLEQSTRPVSDMVEEYVDKDAVHGDDVRIDGATWQAWSDSGGDDALVRLQDDVTTLVVGTIGQEGLVDYVRTLR